MFKDFSGIDKNIFDKIILLSNVNVHKKITNLFNNQNLFLYEKEIILKPDISEYLLGATVGETTYQLCIRLNATTIYLLGTDLSVDNKSGQTHDKMHSANSKIRLDLNNIITHTEDKRINQEKDLLKVEGNLRKEVYTTTFFSKLISYYNTISHRYLNRNQKIYNLSDGAKLDHIESYNQVSKFKKLDILSKDMLHTEMINKLKKVSSNSFTPIEKELIDKEITYVLQVIERIKNTTLDKNDYLHFDKQMSQIITIVLEVDDKNSYSIIRRKIFFNFFNINCNFLDYTLNTNKAFEYIEILKIFNSQLLKYLSIYHKILSKSLK